MMKLSYIEPYGFYFHNSLMGEDCKYFREGEAELQSCTPTFYASEEEAQKVAKRNNIVFRWVNIVITIEMEITSILEAEKTGDDYDKKLLTMLRDVDGVVSVSIAAAANVSASDITITVNDDDDDAKQMINAIAAGWNGRIFYDEIVHRTLELESLEGIEF